MKAFSLVQLYFVLASLVGLVLIIIGSFTLIKLGLDQAIGVQPYPEFTAPYPPSAEKIAMPESSELPESQKQALEQWQLEYSQWQEAQEDYNRQEQNTKRELSQAFAMLLVGLPVFLLHVPRIFREKNQN